MRFTVGPVRVELSGDHPIVDLIAVEMSENSTDERPGDVSFRIHVGTREASQEVSKGTRLALRHSVSLEDDGVLLTQRLKSGPNLYQVLIPAAGSSAYDIYLSPWTLRKVPWDLFLRPVTRDGDGLLPLVAKNVLYEIIDPLIWLSLLSKRATFLHASGVADIDGTGVLFTGTGGVGKSTSLLQLMTDKRYQYLSDDLVVLAEGGAAHRYPKKLQIYAYNLEAQPTWRDAVLADMSKPHVMWWRLRQSVLGASHSRRRLDPSALFGSRIADTANLGHLLWLSPGRSNATPPSPIDPDIVADLLASAIIDEFWGFLQLINVASLALEDQRLNIGSIASEARSIVSDRLKGVSTWETRSASDPRSLLHDVEQLLQS